MENILEMTGKNKLTVKMYREFLAEVDDMYMQLFREQKEQKEQYEKRKSAAKNASKNTPNTPNNPNTPNSQKEKRSIQDAYFQAKNDLITAGLKYGKCRELFIQAIYLDDDYKRIRRKYAEMMNDKKSNDAVEEILIERDEKIFELDSQKNVMECLLDKDIFSDHFRQVLMASKELINEISSVLHQKNDKKNDKTNDSSLEKLKIDIKEMLERYHHDLPMSEKVKIYKSFKKTEFKIGSKLEQMHK